MTTQPLAQALEGALQRRSGLLETLAGEETDCYRLFHGTVEGVPGLTLDRYGPQLIAQSFHQSVSQGALELLWRQICDHLGEELTLYYHDRSAPRATPSAVVEGEAVCRELGVSYRIRGRHRGLDPLLFLDFRAARRRVLQESRDRSVVNFFAYTCGMGICAALGGAKEVLNVDFAASALAVGRENRELNDLEADRVGFLQADFFTSARQLAGLPVNTRRRQGQGPGSYPKLAPRSYDLVILDPPPWAKSPFGTVDLIRDYASVFKPALLATHSGGRLLCTNNVARVDMDDWLDGLRRCARKAGRALGEVERILPEADFPSFDGRHPLKMVLIEVI